MRRILHCRTVNRPNLQRIIPSTHINLYSCLFPSIYCCFSVRVSLLYALYSNSRGNAPPPNLLWRSGVFAHMPKYNGSY